MRIGPYTIIIGKTYNLFKQIEFTSKCSNRMRRYLLFLQSHHEYSYDKLKKAFPEYIK